MTPTQPTATTTEAMRNGLVAARSVIIALIEQEYNVETWGLRSRLAAIESGLSADLSPGDGVPGMVLVPREAGWEMKVAARDIDWPRPNIYGQFSDFDKEKAAAEVWDAMLSTASSTGEQK